MDHLSRRPAKCTSFFLWHNTTRMHVWTHLSPKWENKSGYGLYADGMMELDSGRRGIAQKAGRPSAIADNN